MRVNIYWYLLVLLLLWGLQSIGVIYKNFCLRIFISLYIFQFDVDCCVSWLIWNWEWFVDDN